MKKTQILLSLTTTTTNAAHLILRVCTDGLLLQWLSGASCGPGPPAGKMLSWAFPLTDGEKTLLEFT